MNNKFTNWLLKSKIYLIPKNFGMSIFKKISGVYAKDGLISSHNHDFMKDPKFIKAYKRGVKANGYDYQWEWRVHVGLWAASYASRLDGDFVECGVSKGFLSSSIMEYLNWNKLNKKFYLLDTFRGIDEAQLLKEEVELGRKIQNKKFYSESYEEVKKNFAEFKNVVLVRGSIPSTLRDLNVKKVSFLSIDMNNAKPEVAAAEFFWQKLVKGGIVLLDDYAYSGYYPQKEAFDRFARKKGVKILSLPTGQGLYMKV